jgi:plasmid stabilization system protein ParE
MPQHYIVSNRAKVDIFEIITYIAKENPAAAEQMESDILQAFKLLAGNPGIGHLRNDLTKKPYRFWPLRKRYLIIYQESEMVEIIRVLSGFRDLVTLL